MKPATQTYDVGVITGRFQVPELHAAHIDLIQSVVEQHDKTIIVLGVSPLPVTRQNPLDFQARQQMIAERFPNVIILLNEDQPTDAGWSKNLDKVISAVTSPQQSVVLYGSRDSFISHYSGRYPTLELLQETYVSGTEERYAVAAASTKASPDFRRGVVWAAHGRYPTCYPTVDVAILDETETGLLLARKANENLWRFVGGFADPRSPSYEADARREVEEETHLAITDPEYLGSFLIDDWRYRGESDVIKTLFFAARVFSGLPQADDDIAELKWFDLDRRTMPLVMQHHRPLLARLLERKGHA